MKTKVQLAKRQTPNTSKGITLIALVITIIVLLILAGVAINMAIDSNGLFGKANEAVEGWNTAVANEETTITNLLEIANTVGGTTGGDTVTLPEGWDANKIASTVTETSTITGTNKERVVPIPKGFVASQIGGTTPENTIEKGLVIYQIPEGATVDWESSTITIGEATTNLQETVNQYVWIPVDDINQMVICKYNNKYNGCSIALQTDGTLKCETHNLTDLYGRSYSTISTTTDTETPKTYTTSMNFKDRSQQVNTSAGAREPAVAGSYDNDVNTGNAETFKTQMTDDFMHMAISVVKYGGFYVSRYEAGENGASKKNQVVITAATSDGTVYKGLSNWYGLYNAVRNEIAVGSSTMQSHMIYGSQYDQIINFLESNSNNEPQIAHTDRQLIEQGFTGANEADVMNNIYDLEGNSYEWTAQIYYSSGVYSRVLRGGESKSANSGKFYSASSNRTGIIPTFDSRYYATRISLYL